MKDLYIDKIIMDNFYKIIRDENYPQEKIQEHINKIQKDLDIIKQNGNIEVLKILYLIEENLYEELNKINQIVLIKDNKGIFKDTSTAIIFALDYGKSCFRIQLQSKNEKDEHIVLEVPKAFKDKITNILNTNYKNWETVFKVEIS